MSIVQVKLLNDGLYGDADNVDFPVEVEALGYCSGADVKVSELKRVGFNFDIDNLDDDDTLFFSIRHGECEVVS